MSGQLGLAVLADGTVAVQTALSQALVQWPFLHDTSFVSAITAVFIGADGGAARPLDMALLQPWLYNNVLLINSQLFVPVLEKVGGPLGLSSALALRVCCHIPSWRCCDSLSPALALWMQLPHRKLVLSLGPFFLAVRLRVTATFQAGVACCFES
jgi:hypothetical protein